MRWSRLGLAGSPVSTPMDTIEFLKARGPALLNSREVCTLLGCHSETLYKWIKKGYIEHVRVGGRVKFDPAQLIDYIYRRTA